MEEVIGYTIGIDDEYQLGFSFKYKDNNKNKSLLNLISSFKPNDLCVKCANSPLNGGRCNRRENNLKICEQ